MKKRFQPLLKIVFITLFIASLNAQWKNQLTGNLNLTENKFDNWSQGGEDAWSWMVNLNGAAVLDNARFSWANKGKFSFGKTKVGSMEPRKSADEIKLSSVFTLKKGKNINPYLSMTGQTQFAAGYAYPGDTIKLEVSNLLDPAYFTQSAGIGFNPAEGLDIRAGASLKQTITSDHPVPFADDPDTEEIEKSRFEYGAEAVGDYSRTFGENLVLTSSINLFSNLKSFGEIDADWDTQLTAKITKYVNTSLNVRILYDSDISLRRQYKQVLSLGLNYVFI